MATSTIEGKTIIGATGVTNQYGLFYLANADKIKSIVITSPVQCIPLYYSNQGIRVVNVSDSSGNFVLSWLGNTTVTFNVTYI